MDSTDRAKPPEVAETKAIISYHYAPKTDEVNALLADGWFLIGVTSQGLDTAFLLGKPRKGERPDGT